MPADPFKSKSLSWYSVYMRVLWVLSLILEFRWRELWVFSLGLLVSSDRTSGILWWGRRASLFTAGFHWTLSRRAVPSYPIFPCVWCAQAQSVWIELSVQSKPLGCCWSGWGMIIWTRGSGCVDAGLSIPIFNTVSVTPFRSTQWPLAHGHFWVLPCESAAFLLTAPSVSSWVSAFLIFVKPGSTIHSLSVILDVMSLFLYHFLAYVYNFF